MPPDWWDVDRVTCFEDTFVLSETGVSWEKTLAGSGLKSPGEIRRTILFCTSRTFSSARTQSTSIPLNLRPERAEFAGCDWNNTWRSLQDEILQLIDHCALLIIVCEFRMSSSDWRGGADVMNLVPGLNRRPEQIVLTARHNACACTSF